MYSIYRKVLKIYRNVLKIYRNVLKIYRNVYKTSQNLHNLLVWGGEDLINATQTLTNYLTNKYNLKQLNDTYYSLGFQQKLSLISENIDLAKLIFKNNFQKL